MKSAILVLLALFTSSCFALGPLLFGPEFTFDIHSRQQMRSVKALLSRMRRHLIQGQAPGARFQDRRLSKRRVRFTSPNGWSYIVATDPSVIEIQMTPTTVEVFRHFKADMQDAIFASASNERMFPSDFRGGGHINISMSAFEGNLLLLRNFLVDLYNHNELFMGVFGYDTHNALPLSLYQSERRAEVQHILETFDPNEATLNDLPIALARAQQNVVEPFLLKWRTEPTPRIKAFAVNYNHVDDTIASRIEVRAVRPQASMDVWVRQISLFQSRLKYLETLTEPIPFKERVAVQEIDFVNARHEINPPVDPQEALRSFYIYVTEAGEKWKDHTDYLWPDWVRGGEVEKFENSEWFQEQEARSCERQLGVGA